MSVGTPDLGHLTLVQNHVVGGGASSWEPVDPNYALLATRVVGDQLAAAGVRIETKREDYPYVRFAWIWDPEGNRVELWQPL